LPRQKKCHALCRSQFGGTRRRGSPVRRGGVPSFTSRRRPPARRRVGPRPVGGRGPKIGPPNFPSERSALSYEHAGKIEAQLKSEVADLLRGRKLRIRLIFRTACRSRRNWAARGAIVAEARARIEARAKERYARELAEHEAKLAAREAKVAATGKKPGGKPPQPPTEGPKPSDQINLTDECLWPAAALSSVITRRPPWQREACWWLLWMWFRHQTTSSRLSLCWARWRLTRRIG
jgi:hypothetical protein